MTCPAIRTIDTLWPRARPRPALEGQEGAVGLPSNPYPKTFAGTESR